LQPLFGKDAKRARTSITILRTAIDTWISPEAPWSVLEDQYVLDIASGSVSSEYPPWFSRVCAVFGAHVYSIDLKPQEGVDARLLHWASADVIKTVLSDGIASIPLLKGRSFDLIHSYRFVGSNPDFDALRILEARSVSLNDFREKFIRQAFGLLKPNGYMDVDIQ
jgi:hypothetical protein